MSESAKFQRENLQKGTGTEPSSPVVFAELGFISKEVEGQEDAKEDQTMNPELPAAHPQVLPGSDTIKKSADQNQSSDGFEPIKQMVMKDEAPLQKLKLVPVLSQNRDVRPR